MKLTLPIGSVYRLPDRRLTEHELAEENEEYKRNKALIDSYNKLHENAHRKGNSPVKQAKSLVKDFIKGIVKFFTEL